MGWRRSGVAAAVAIGVERLWVRRGDEQRSLGRLLLAWGGSGGEGRRLADKVSFNLIGFDIESRRGVDEAPS
jgi:hypothetical protein